MLSTSLTSTVQSSFSRQTCHSSTFEPGIKLFSMSISNDSTILEQIFDFKYLSLAILTKISMNSNLMRALSGLSPYSSASKLTTTKWESIICYVQCLSIILAFLTNDENSFMVMAGYKDLEAIYINYALSSGIHLTMTV